MTTPATGNGFGRGTAKGAAGRALAGVREIFVSIAYFLMVLFAPGKAIASDQRA